LTNSIVDVPGIHVGSAEDAVSATGCTAIIFPDRATCGVDIGGGSTGTREFALLAPTASMSAVDAIVLTGGSVFGLDAVTGVVDYLEQQHQGAMVGNWCIPIVPAAVLFDLNVGNGAVRPDRAMGFTAAASSSKDAVRAGNYGVGCGATVGKLGGMRHAMKGGIGSASRSFENGLVIGAFAAVNALGDVYSPASNRKLAGRRDDATEVDFDSPTSNTTLAVVGANVKLTKAEASVVARMAQDGLARTIRPSHTTRDGDVVFAVGTGDLTVDIDLYGSVAAELVAESIIAAVLKAWTFGDTVAHSDVCDAPLCDHVQ